MRFLFGGRLRVVVLLALVAAAMAALPAAANPPGTNGMLTFARFNPTLGDTQVYVVNPDATGKRQITSNPGDGVPGSWSPNGGSPTGNVARQPSAAAGAPVVVADPAIVPLGGSASVKVHGLAGRRLEVRLAGATTAAGAPLGWRSLRLESKVWRGSLPKPALLGIYPIEVRAGAGQPVARSANWMLRVFVAGTLSRPSFATPEGVAKWWVWTATAHARLIALRRWPRPGFDLRDQRLHQLLVVAYSPVGHPDVDDRLGMFVTAVRNGFHGRWRLLEATLQP